MKIAVTIEDGTVGKDYLDSLARSGFASGEIAVLHSADVPPFAFDGLLLGGGEDVDPALYGEARRPELGRVNRRRDDQELGLIAAARRRGAPIFAICRGIQVVNVACGGTLLQDIPAEAPSAVDHRVREPKTAMAHEVSASGAAALPDGSFRVNSRHHQAIARLGSGLRAVAHAPDGLVEAVEGEGIVAVQWHPENLAGDAVADRLFRAFREAVVRRARRVE
ncbi:MAG TPA: gamma-glutamyl-gamma-aminobutyrate hydrolase family protein [Thermoanaerobaculia bacterium]|nr:gamma-glutamyl-gamma-aminobutyrate hydrolase family protein [Thermoanaerobaculia bacterium]